MNSMRHLPGAILALMLFAAAAAMGIGWVVAREEREVLVRQDHEPLTEFVSEFQGQIDFLEKNLDRTLLDLCRQISPGMSDRSMISLAATYAGVRQISVVKTGRLGKGPILEQSLDLAEAFPLPVISGQSGFGNLEAPGVPYFWTMGPKRHLYFVSRQTAKVDRILVLGIDRAEIAEAMTQWLGKWAKKSHDPLVRADLNHELISPAGAVLAGSGVRLEPPATVYPIASRVGNWRLDSWNQRATVVEYRDPVLITAGALSIALALMGISIFVLLRRSLVLAAQRVSFVNQVSHELRTPLTNIMLNLDLARDSVAGNGSATRRLGLMGEELERLHRLLENVLTFSARKEKHARPILENLSLATEVRQALAQSAPTLKRRGIVPETDLDDALRILADRDALARILGNLFSNVAKYGGADSELILRSELANGKVTLNVIDSGPGIVGKNRERIFRPFFRLSDRVNEGVTGSGLGLAISRDLIALMNGRLTCRERADGKTGSSFELTLPAAHAAIVPFDSKVS